jgi:hypothetical protein
MSRLTVTDERSPPCNRQIGRQTVSPTTSSSGCRLIHVTGEVGSLFAREAATPQNAITTAISCAHVDYCGGLLGLLG